MPPLIVLIMALIEFIPAALKALQAIIDFIHGNLQGVEKRAAEKQLRGIVIRHIKSRNEESCLRDLAQLHGDLKGKYGG